MDAAQPVVLHFPKGGIDLSQATLRQPWRPGPRLPDGTPSRVYTCAEAVNVRGYEPLTSRTRGGTRVGLKRWINTPVIDGWIIQHLNVVTGIKSGGGVQGSTSGRVVTVVPVSQGRVFWAQPGSTAWTEATNSSSSSPPLNFSGAIFSAPNNQKLYFVDGARYRKFTPITNVVTDWTATSGTLPVDSGGNRARLIETWRGRTVVAGLLEDSANWFMSAVSNPDDFNYSPVSITPTQAVAGNNSRLGFIGDNIMSLAAYNDDLMFFGGNSSIWMMRGDPMTGGQLDLITSVIGTAFGKPFTQDPKGVLYFMANSGRIYMMQPGQKAEPISTGIDKQLQDIDMGNNAITLIWNERYKGFHVFVTPIAAASSNSRAFFWEYPRENATGNAWFKDRFKDKKHYPICACMLDGNTPSDRVVLIGSWDGYVRSFDPDAVKDDGEDIEWEVWIGPLLTKDFDEITLKRMQAILAANSGRVNYRVYVGRTPEEALSSNGLDRGSGTWTALRNLSSLGGKIAGHAIFIKLFGTDRMAMEGIRAELSPNLSKFRRRGA